LPDPEALIQAVVAWAGDRPDVHAVVLVGSRAREIVPADEWSDVDLALVVDDPDRYLDDPDWAEAFGRPLLTFVEPTPFPGAFERRVLYEDGLDVDFSFFPPDWVRAAVTDPATAVVVNRGHRLFLDRMGARELLDQAAGVEDAGPSSAGQLAALGADFWYHALWAARKLQRGEVWIAKQACDCYLKSLLVRLLAWHTRARDPEVDTWHGGRFLERWADPPALEELRGAYATYDADGVARALEATMALFERLERECAENLGAVVSPAHADVRARTRSLLRL
jgi:aminoglycoside 6-adenylyltransferase